MRGFVKVQGVGVFGEPGTGSLECQPYIVHLHPRHTKGQVEAL